MIEARAFVLLPLLLASVSTAVAPKQEALKNSQVQQPDPSVASSIKSIFSSLSAPPTSSTSSNACCAPSCALGRCNDYFTPVVTAPPTAGHTVTASPAIVTSSCCTAGCPDGACQRARFPWQPDRAFPDDGCSDRGGCTSVHPISNGPLVLPGGCDGRYCDPPTGTKLGTFTSIYPTPSSVATPHQATPNGNIIPSPDDEGDDGTEIFHAVELAGFDYDTTPIIVTNSTGAPVTLLANIELALTENYISTAMLTALGLPSKSSPHQLINIAKPKQRTANLDGGNLLVTLHAKINLDFLLGPSHALKHFANVEFNVFDLPDPSSSKTGVTVEWQREVFLGVTFLRDALALRLAEGFAGNPAVEGVPVLVRNLKGYKAKVNAGGGVWEKEDLKKDEL